MTKCLPSRVYVCAMCMCVCICVCLSECVSLSLVIAAPLTRSFRLRVCVCKSGCARARVCVYARVQVCVSVCMRVSPLHFVSISQVGNKRFRELKKKGYGRAQWSFRRSECTKSLAIIKHTSGYSGRARLTNIISIFFVNRSFFEIYISIFYYF